jgi:hypothetical protein
MNIARKQNRARPAQEIFLGRLTKGNWLTDVLSTVLWVTGVMAYMLILSVIFLLLVPVSHPLIQAAPAAWGGLLAFPIILVLYATRQTAPFLATQGIRWNYVRIYFDLTIFALVYSVLVAILLTHFVIFAFGLVAGFLLAHVAITLSSRVRNVLFGFERGFSALAVAVAVTLTITQMNAAALAKINGAPIVQAIAVNPDC